MNKRCSLGQTRRSRKAAAPVPSAASASVAFDGKDVGGQTGQARREGAQREIEACEDQQRLANQNGPDSMRPCVQLATSAVKKLRPRAVAASAIVAGDSSRK